MDIFYFTYTKINNSEPLINSTIEYFDITFVISGTMHYYINGKKVDVCENDAILFFSGDNRMRECGENAEYYSFNFEWDDYPYRVNGPHGYLKNCITHEIRELLFLYDKCNKSFTLHSKDKCIHYFYNIILSLLEFNNNTPSNLKVISIKKFIADHICSNITLDDISRHAFFAPNYCTYIFKKKTGFTIFDYIILEKMQVAKFEILKREKTLTEISMYLGYQDYSYFSRLFKKTYGLSPVKYRGRYTDYATEKSDKTP